MAEEPMFIMFKGRGKRQLQPASSRGWIAFAVFMLILLGPLPIVLWAGVALQKPWLTVLHLIWAGFAVLLFIRFATARATVIDLDEVKRDWQAFRAWRDKGKPR